MLYVEPVYVKGSQENAVPLLQKVLMSYGDGGTYVVLADSLTAGLEQLVEQGKAAGTGTQPPAGGTPPAEGDTPPPPQTGQLAQAAADVDRAIAAVKTAQQSGDFAAYGEALKNLETAMDRFQAAQRAATGTAAAPSTAPSGPASTPPSQPAPTPSG
jgi:uncharacterized membrane protein (UPF0182 family)